MDGVNGGPAMILIYHRVAQLERDPQWLCVSPGQFDEQMDVLSRQWRAVSLTGLADSVRAGDVPGDAVAVTFDDGYADNWTHAAPILQRHGVPATIFVTTHGDAPDRELWWDELERLVLGPHTLPPRMELMIAGQPRTWDLSAQMSAEFGAVAEMCWNVSMQPDTPRRRMYVDLHQALRIASATTRWNALDQLRRIVGLAHTPRPTHRLMSCDEIAGAAASDLIEIGAHTVTHPVLATLSPEDQRWEMSESRERLADIIHSACLRVRTAHRAGAHGNGLINSVSYPYGGRRDYTSTTIEIAREIGFTAGCANHAGLVTGDSNPLALPRVLVRDWGGDEFERRIELAFAHAGRTDGHPANQHV